MRTHQSGPRALSEAAGQAIEFELSWILVYLHRFD